MSYTSDGLPSSHWKRNTAFFLSGQAVSLFGSALVEFAVIWHITLSTKSGVFMTIGTLCAFVPRLFISFFAGVWADRYPRKRLIIFADMGIALVTLLLAIAFLSGYQELWLIFVVLGIRSVGTGIQTPAVSAVMPQMVPREQLMRVNGLNGSLQSIIMLLAPMASGALLTFLPLGDIFFIDVFTALIAIVILWTIPIRPHEGAAEKRATDYYADIKEGLRYIKTNVFVREMFIMYTLYFLLITPIAILSPLYVARVFGDEVWRLTANEIAFSAGMMLGGGVIAWWGGFKNGINTIALSLCVIGIAHIILGFPGFSLYLAMLLVMGVFSSFFSATEMTLFQKAVHQNMQGRIFSIIQIIATAIVPAGMLIFGPLSDIVSIHLQFIVCGVCITALSLFVFFNKSLKGSVPEEKGLQDV